MTQSIPNGYNTITPNFTFQDASKAIEFYKKAFGAEVIDQMPNQNGEGVMHATLKIGSSIIMMGDEMPSAQNCSKSSESLGRSPISLFVYVSNADAAFDKAVKAGGVVKMPIAEMFWGDRCGTITDPFGYSWTIASHTKDLSKEEIQKGAAKFFETMGKSKESQPK